MFNDRFGLTDAVLEGRKTMTRRIARFDETERPCQKGRDKCLYCDHYDRENGCKWLLNYSPYKVGEVLAVAQSYKDIRNGGYPVDSRYDAFRAADFGIGENGVLRGTAGENNKMFVKADLMPHQIRITDIKLERLQIISDEDCMREGIVAGELKHEQPNSYISVPLPYGGYVPFTFTNAKSDYLCAKDAFAALIDKISGKGTWEKNPYVFAYTFELIK